jgi:hypothetical protein
MSTKSTIYLSDDNEHWYTEHASASGKDIVLEFDKANIEDVINGFDALIVTVKGDSDLAMAIKKAFYQSNKAND